MLKSSKGKRNSAGQVKVDVTVNGGHVFVCADAGRATHKKSAPKKADAHTKKKLKESTSA